MFKTVLGFEEEYPSGKTQFRAEWDSVDHRHLGQHVSQMLRMAFSNRSDPDLAFVECLSVALDSIRPDAPLGAESQAVLDAAKKLVVG